MSKNIVAVATAHGYAGIGVVRVSGTDLLQLAYELTRLDDIVPNYAYYCAFLDKHVQPIDYGLLLYFKSPHSFTGEDVLELQAHGSPIILNMLVTRCCELGCVLANPGEFSYRAYQNNKIDLIQAESIIDIIYAENQLSAQGAVRSLSGVFSDKVNVVLQQLIKSRMLIEAFLDFPEEDLELVGDNILQQLLSVQHEMQQLVMSAEQGVTLNDGFDIAIIGAPNVGKSTLFNALADEDVAIVTNIAGTTRDVLKQKITINGISCNLIDTAGVHDTQDYIEQLGITRALNIARTCHLCLLVLDASVSDQPQLMFDVPAIVVHNKSDLLQSYDLNELYVSAKTGHNLDLLRRSILDRLGCGQNTPVFTARSRHHTLIKSSLQHVDYAIEHYTMVDISAESLRLAQLELSKITGEYTPDDLLGEIFSKFCVGK